MENSYSNFRSGLLSRLSLLLLLSIFWNLPVSAQTAFTGMRGITALEATAEMAPGINLYNTLDAYCWYDDQGLESETCWGNPYTTPEMVAAFAERGFKTIRIPVTWYNHMGAYPDYIIDPAWMDRVEEVASYAFDNNMYVIINIHHDDYDESKAGTWISPTYEKQDTVIDQVEKVWAQIATRFRDYGDYLIFETLNEPREKGSPQEWTGGSTEHRAVVNAFNLAAVNTIRGTGGNNESRFIMLPQVAANGGTAMEDLIIPNNDTNTIVSFHAYDPFWFCLDENGSSTWGSSADIASLRNNLKTISDHFIANGQAVVLGEWGAGDKDNYADRVTYYDVHANACVEFGITSVVWMYGFNRNILTWTAPLIEDAIIQAYDSTTVDVEDVILNITSDTLLLGDTLQLAATIVPDTATSQDVVWTSYNKGIAMINSAGLVMATGRGVASIKATSIGKEAECRIVVMDTVDRVDFFYEAEDYISQSGIQTESCSDENGGLNIGYIQNGDWTSYHITIDSAGIYDFTARAATETNGGTIEIRANNLVLGTANVEGSKTNGWQDWYTTEAVEIEMEEGSFDLRLTFKGGGAYLFNLNYFEINYNRPKDLTSIQKDVDDNANFQVYPNPFSDLLYVDYQLSSLSDVDIRVMDMNGRVLRSLHKDTKQMPGNYTLSWNGDGLADGIYFLSITVNNRITTKKLFLNR